MLLCSGKNKSPAHSLQLALNLSSTASSQPTQPSIKTCKFNKYPNCLALVWSFPVSPNSFIKLTSFKILFKFMPFINPCVSCFHCKVHVPCVSGCEVNQPPVLCLEYLFPDSCLPVSLFCLYSLVAKPEVCF